MWMCRCDHAEAVFDFFFINQFKDAVDLQDLNDGNKRIGNGVGRIQLWTQPCVLPLQLGIRTWLHVHQATKTAVRYPARHSLAFTSASGSRAGSARGVSARSSERLIHTLQRADCPRALATGMSARLMWAALPRAPASGLRLPHAPAAPTSRCRGDGPWDCGLQLPRWPWWPATVACAVKYSLSRWPPRLLRRQLPDCLEYPFRSWPTAVWVMLADAESGARRSNTPIRQKSGPRKTACPDLPSGPHHLWGLINTRWSRIWHSLLHTAWAPQPEQVMYIICWLGKLFILCILCRLGVRT